MMAVLPFMALSCAPEEVFNPGEPDLEGCYGVYFPTQDASGSHAIAPSAPKTVDFVVKRLVKDDEITVPVEVTASEEGIFTVSELTFADGQTESKITVTFEKAQVGVDYSLTLSISDPQYVSTYATSPTYISYSVIVEKWVELGEGKYMDYYFSQDKAGTIPTVAPVKILQNENNPTQFRIYDPFVNYFFGPEYPYKERPAEYFEISILKKGQVFTPYDNATPVEIPLPNLIWYENIVTGYVNSNYDDTICYVHPGYGFKDYMDPATWEYNKVLGYQENGLPIAVQLAPFVYMWSVGGWDYAQEPIVTILFPGGVLTDYTISIDSGFSNEGQLPVAFTFGKDVATIKYAAYEGPLSAQDVAKKAAEIAADSEAASIAKPAADAEGNVPAAVVNLSFPTTGEYTLVAVGCDETGAAKSSESLLLSYLAADDEVPVLVKGGISSADKYVPLGLSPETAVEFYLYGQDLVDVKVGLFSAADLTDVQACLAAVQASESLPADDLETINTEVYVDVFTGLTPGTEYRMIVWASNGYEQTAILTDPWTTAGDPLPVYASYSMDDIKGELLPATSEGYFGKYNYYAKDFFGESPLREYIGSIQITDSEYPDIPEDEKGLVTEYVKVKGMFGGEAAYYGFDDTMDFEYYGGVLYQLPNYFLNSKSGYHFAVMYLTAGGDLYGHNNAYTMLGGFVSEGYIAFMDATGSYGFNGWFLRAFADESCSTPVGNVSCYQDVLLVNPAVDDNGLAPSATPQSVMSRRDLDKLKFNLGSEINYVETERGRIHSMIDRMHAEKKTPKMVGQMAGIKGEWDAPSVEFTAVDSDPQYQTKTKVRDAAPVRYR